MKRKVFAVIMAAVILVCGAGLADMPEIDYDSLTQEELVKMREAIDSRIQLVGTGDVVYEKDGYVIKWLGIDTKKNYVYPIMMITNTTQNIVNLNIVELGFNGVVFEVYQNFRITPGMTRYTGDKIFYVETAHLKKVGLSLDNIEDVYIGMEVFDRNFKLLFDDNFSFVIQ